MGVSINRFLPWLVLILLFSLAGCLAKGTGSDSAKSLNSSTSELEKSADEYVLSGNSDLALLQYEKALKAGGDVARLNYKIGLAHLGKKGYDRALENFKICLAKDENNALALQGAGFASFNLGQTPQAEEYLKKALSKRQDLPICYALLGLISSQRKDPEQARKYFEDELKYAQSPDAYNNLGLTFMAQKRYPEAVEAFSKAQRLAPLPKISNNLGLAYCRQQKFEEALTAFKNAGSDASAFNNLGMCYLKFGEKQKAQEYFQKAIEANPKYYAVANENLSRSGGQGSAPSQAQQEALSLEQLPAPPKLQEKVILENAQIKVEEATAPQAKPGQAAPAPLRKNEVPAKSEVVFKSPSVEQMREPKIKEVTPQVSTDIPQVALDAQPQAAATQVQTPQAPADQAAAQAASLPQQPVQPASNPAQYQPPQPVQAASPGKPGKLSEVRLVDEGQYVALYLGASAPMLDYSFYFKDSPTGLVLDVKGDWQLGVPGVVAGKAGNIDKVRLGVHPGKLRVVIDFSAPTSKPMAEPLIEKLPQGLVLKLKK